MRARNAPPTTGADLDGRTFSDWLLALGEDRLQSAHEGYVKCPPNMIVRHSDEDQGHALLIDCMYPGKSLRHDGLIH